MRGWSTSGLLAPNVDGADVFGKRGMLKAYFLGDVRVSDQIVVRRSHRGARVLECARSSPAGVTQDPIRKGDNLGVPGASRC